MSVLLSFDITLVSLPTTFSLAVVAVIGYLVGRWQKVEVVQSDLQSRREIKRAQMIAKELETIAREVRKSLARHHTSVNRFKTRISDLAKRGQDIGLQEVCREAEDILGPTMVLATDLAKAYDQIRRQSHGLLSFVEVRTDQLTGICNRKSLDDSLEQLVALHNRYDLRFSLAMFDIDYFKKINDEQGHVAGDQILRNVAQTIDGTARDTDVVTRYGGEEFVVLMPQTELTGACVFAERVRQLVQRKLKVSVSGGVAIVTQAETAQMLLERVDAALYQAKTAGRNRVFVHVGHGIEAVESILDPVADDAAIEAEQSA
ncbi:MAG: GGDEF domain-containing protein [Planctomycetaceae bacterium]|nr:GGDEF domain-containing protein [Planctomycetaceae bacterium]